MKFEKVIEQNEDGKDVEVLKVTQSSISTSTQRTTSMEEQENLLEGMKQRKLIEIQKWDARIAAQRQRLIDAATALGVPVDEKKLDADPAPLVEAEQIKSAGGIDVSKSK